MGNFIHLHNHSEYSLLDGACRIKDMLAKAKELGMKALALTDHGNLFGSIEFYQTAKAMGIKPIIGMEAYVCEDMKSRTSLPNNQSGSYHLTLLVKNETGYRNLLKISSVAYLEGFYYKPRVDKAYLAKHAEGLIALSGCLKGEIPNLLLGGEIEKAKKVIDTYRDIFGSQNFYIELMNHGMEEERQILEPLISLAGEMQVPYVATNDIHYINPEDTELQEVMLCIQTGKTMNDEKRMKFSSDQFYFRTEEEMEKVFEWTPDALDNSAIIADQCNLELEFDQYLVPSFPLPEGFQDHALYLRNLVEEGLKKHYPDLDEKIRQRVEYEMAVIEKMGYVGYFLIVWDFIHYARSNSIPVGPGRGSAAGSIVSYCLGITNIDPLRYDLLFERFLNPERISMPDIDIDFCINGREKVINYVQQKYGEKNVCQIITFGRMMAKNSVRDVGRVLGYPYEYVNQLAKLIPDGPDVTLAKTFSPDKSDPESEEIRKQYQESEMAKKILDLALRIEGMARQVGKHAAGVVIAPKPLTNFVALFNGKEGITSQIDMKYLESLGLLKMDFLGLKTLTVIDQALKLIEQNHGKAIDLERLPLDDSKVFELLSRGQTNGIFQFESPKMQEYLQKLKPSVFEDIIAMNALYRPGPIKNKMVDEFIDRKHDPKKIDYMMPELEPILKETYGIIVYQEQVMRIAGAIAGFTMGEADTLRKAMGKKKRDLMEKFQAKFVEGAAKNNFDKDKAATLYNMIAQFAEYGFNKSHSACYALVAYYTAYLKAHYPVEFISALSTSVLSEADKVVKYIEEAKNIGIEVLPPDINTSYYEFTVEKNGIRFALGGIKTVGEAAINDIISFRNEKGVYTTFFDFIKRAMSGGAVKKNTIEALIWSGVLDAFGKRSQMKAALDDAIQLAQKINQKEHSQQASLFDMFEDSASAMDYNFTLPQAEELKFKEKLDMEKHFLGFFLTGHPLDDYKDFLALITPVNELAENPSEKFYLGGMITDFKPKVSKKDTNRRFAFFTLEDQTGSQEFMIFSEGLDKYESLLQQMRIVVCLVNKNQYDNNTNYIAEKVFPIEETLAHINLQMIIRIKLEEINNKYIDQIVETINRYPGSIGVRLELGLNGRETPLEIRTKKYKVAPAYKLLQELKTVPGITHARYEAV